jgi:predicted peptidase
MTKTNSIISFLKGFAPILLFISLISSCKKSEIAHTPLVPKDSVTISLQPVTEAVDTNIGGYYAGIPTNYNSTTEAYPLLVYVPGAGQFGNGVLDLPLLLNDGVVELIDEKRFPGTFHVQDRTFSFIIFSPQCKHYPSPEQILDCIELAEKKYRIDPHRIYLSGLSIGSIISCDLAAEIPSRIAALVPMAGVPLDYDTTGKCQKIADSQLPVWAFHSADDPEISVTAAQGFVGKINSLHPLVPARITVWPNGGHDAWTRAIDPLYKENGMNIYEWMLQYSR